MDYYPPIRFPHPKLKFYFSYYSNTYSLVDGSITIVYYGKLQYYFKYSFTAVYFCSFLAGMHI